jgi:hypothetical protein
VGTHRPYDLVLDSHKTKLHCTSNEFPNGPQKVYSVVEHIPHVKNEVTNALSCCECIHPKLHNVIVLDEAATSVSNGFGPSLRVWVRALTTPLRYWRSELSIIPNCPLGYGSMVHSQPVRIGRVVSRSPSRFIYRFISGSFICSVLIVCYQNRIFSNQ